MTQDTATQLALQAIEVAIKVAGPFLLAGLVVGLLISVFQAATSIQEATLSFIPKILVTAVVIVVGGPWMLSQLLAYTTALYQSIPSLVGLAVSIFQAATSIQEATLSFIPKLVVTGAVVAFAGPWMIDEITGYTQALFESIPSLVAH